MVVCVSAACSNSGTPHSAGPAPPVIPYVIPSPDSRLAPDIPSGADAARDAELARIVAGVIDVVANSDPVFTRDGTRVAFVSNRDGLPQLYVGDVAQPAAAPLRLVQSTERIESPLATPDGAALVFRSDHDADENWSYYRVNLDGSGLVELTPGPRRHRDAPLIAQAKPETIFYSARPASEAQVAVYRTSARAPAGETRIYRDDQPGTLRDVNQDGTWGLLRRDISSSEAYVLAVDLETGASHPLYPPPAAAAPKVAIYDARFSGDGKRALITTDGGGEQALVLSIDVETGRETARYVETRPVTALIEQIYVSAASNTAVLLLRAGGHSDVRVLDATTLRPRAAVTLPLGDGGDRGSFSHDGKRFALTWSTPNVPDDIYAVDVATGAVAPLRREARPALDGLPPIEVSITKVSAFDRLPLPTHVFRPAGSSGKKLPVIVEYHGGPASSAWIQWSPATRLLIGQGYAVVQPNVRGSTGFGRAFEAADNGRKRLDAFRDVETIARWVASQRWADKRRMVAFGGSYGGYTVLIGLTRMPGIWRAGVEEIGFANLPTALATTNGTLRAIFRVEFGDVDRDGEFLESISPLADAGKIVAPLFVYAGAHDPRAARSESDRIVNALRVRQVPVEYMIAENEGHSMDHRETQLAFFSRMLRFLETHLK